MSGSITVVEYSAEHLEELIPMWRASFEKALSIVDPHPIEDQRRYFLEETLPSCNVRVALDGARVVGFVAASADVLAQLYLHVDYQRQGLGRRLLDWAKEQSSGVLALYTFECNVGAQRFYEEQGFVVTDRGFEETWQLADVRYEWRRR